MVKIGPEYQAFGSKSALVSHRKPTSFGRLILVADVSYQHPVGEVRPQDPSHLISGSEIPGQSRRPMGI